MKDWFKAFFEYCVRLVHIIGDRISKLFDRVIYSKSLALFVSLLISAVICFSLYSTEISLEFFKSEIVTQTFPNIPVEMQIDDELYAVSGLPDTANVQLTGPSADLQVLKNQSSIAIVVDLRNLGEGLNEILLTASNVPSNVSAEVEPSDVTVNIERKITRTYTATPELLLGSGQNRETFNTPVLSQTSISITGTRSKVNSIRSVKAIIDASGRERDFESEALIVAYDSAGRQVTDLTFNPQTVMAQVTVNTTDNTNNADQAQILPQPEENQGQDTVDTE